MMVFIKIFRDIEKIGVEGRTCQRRDGYPLLKLIAVHSIVAKECGPSVLVHVCCTRVATIDCVIFGGNSVPLLKSSCNQWDILSIIHDHYFWVK